MGVAFALTKIQPPRARPDTVPRAALEQRLGQALDGARLVLLSAPAGFGKTTALTRQLLLHGSGCAPAWITVDEQDDLVRFVACLVAALEPYDVPWRRSPAALLASADASAAAVRAIASEILNALAATEVAKGLIVIDDAHRLADPAVLALLEALIERLPARWTMAIASRFDPALPLARWRARGELAEFRLADLRFEPDEVEALVRRAGGHAPATELLQRTEGWAAGLRLSLSACATARLAGATTQRHVFEYLASEVLDQMPAPLRRFLLRCSVLPELSAGRCAAVSGDARAAQWLEEIERRGLFVTVLDEMPLTLRLHDLFRDFLQDRLQRDPGEDLPALLVRAAAGEQDPARQIDLLLRAGDPAAAQRALAVATPTLLLEGASAQALHLIDRFPPALREASPLLAFVRGLCAWPRFEWATMQEAMARAGGGFERLGLPGQTQQARAFESVALTALGRLDAAAQRLAQVRALPMERDTAALVELMSYWQAGARGPAAAPALHLQRMVDLLAGGAPPQVWYRCIPHFLFVGRPGMRAPMERFARLALDSAGESHQPLRASAQCLQAWLLLWQGRADDAEALIRLVQDDDRWLGQPRNLRITILAFLAALHTLRADRDAFRAAAREMLADVDRDAERRATWRGVYLYHVGRLAVAQDDWAFADEVLQALAATPSDREWPLMRGARAALAAERALRDGDAALARERLEPVLAMAADHDMLNTEAAIRVALARALGRLGEPARAAAVLAPAIEQAAASGEAMPLLIAGPAALAELARSQGPGDTAAQLARWAADAAALRRAPASGLGVAQRPAQAALTEREREVLEHIAAGDSNKLIARALDLSPHTVKRHVANLLDKIGVATRGQAAAWHRDHARPPAGGRR
jgi:LuxR family maltose regulon positive regulatory protein